MEENGKKRDGPVIAGLIALIVVLFVGVKLIFAGLGAAIPRAPAASPPAASREAEASQSGALPAPNYCPHCGQGLPESFRWGQFCPYCGEEAKP